MRYEPVSTPKARLSGRRLLRRGCSERKSEMEGDGKEREFAARDKL